MHARKDYRFGVRSARLPTAFIWISRACDVLSVIAVLFFRRNEDREWSPLE